MNLMLNVQYNSNYSLPSRFISHFILGVKTNIRTQEDEHAIPKNLCERTGDLYLWTVEHLPRHIWNGLKEPRVVTIVLTTFALIATSFAFYPVTTALMMKIAIATIPCPPLWAVKFALYLHTCSLIVSTALRAEGRFTNRQLMESFYQAHRIDGN